MKKQYLQPTIESLSISTAWALCELGGSGRQDSGTGTGTQHQDPGFTPPQSPGRVF